MWIVLFFSSMGLKTGYFFNFVLPKLIMKEKIFNNLLRICGEGSPQNLAISVISQLNNSEYETSFTFQIQVYYSSGTFVIF